MSGPKKQVPLRLSVELYDRLCRWARDDFRSLNGQIEFLLSRCVTAREKTGGYDFPPEKRDVPLSGGAKTDRT